MQISIVVPTYKRPKSLHDALVSIRNQSRADLISEVIVSENSCDDASENVAKQFNDLPLRFVRRDPPLSPGEHFYVAASEARSDWLAMLADDDTWGRYHLEEASRLLALHPEATAYVCQAANVRSPNRRIQLPTWSTLASFSSAYSSHYTDAWIWDTRQIAVELLIRTSINLWGVVASKEAFVRALVFFIEDNPGIDIDRYVLWRLFSQGKAVIGHEATLFYRYHDQSTTSQSFHENLEHHYAKSAEYSSKIILECEERGIDLKAEWIKRINQLNKAESRAYWNAPLASSGAQAFLQKIWPEVVSPYVISDTAIKQILRGVTPPILWNLLRRLKYAAGKR